MSPRILIVSPHVHSEPHSGAGMRGHFQAVHLSKTWPVTLATDTGIFKVSNSVFTQTTKSELREVSARKAYTRSLLTGSHYLFQKYNCREWPIPHFDQFSHLIIHYPALLHLLDGKPPSDSVVILETHNNEREYYESIAARTGNPVRRAAMRMQAGVSERLIRRNRHDIAATISVSENDRSWVASLCSSRTRHFVIPNNLFRYDPTVWSGRRSILFVGSLNVTMNLQALDWFTRNVWPRLSNLEPDIEFVVAGRNPSTTLISNLQNQGIEVVANAPSLKPLYADAICSLVPALSGSGSKIKVAEALAYGVPVLTTNYGLIGQPPAIRKQCIVRDDADGWIEAITAQASRADRTDTAWTDQVSEALGATSYETSVQQLSKFIAETSR